jgi:hypothetical protein
VEGTAVAGLNPDQIILTVLSVIGFVATVTAGIRKGLAETKKIEPDAGLRVASAVLMENTTMKDLTESNREQTESNRQLIAVLKDLTHEVRENRHQTERLIDRLK